MNMKIIILLLTIQNFGVVLNSQSLIHNVLQYNEKRNLPKNVKSIEETIYNIASEGEEFETTLTIDSLTYQLAKISSKILFYNKLNQEIEHSYLDTFVRQYNVKGYLIKEVLTNKFVKQIKTLKYDKRNRFVNLSVSSSELGNDEYMTCKYYKKSGFEISEISSTQGLSTEIKSTKNKNFIQYHFETSLNNEFKEMVEKSNQMFIPPTRRGTLKLAKPKNYIFDIYTDKNEYYPNSFHTKHEYNKCGKLVLEMKWKNNNLIEHIEYKYLESSILHERKNVISNNVTKFEYGKNGEKLKEIGKYSSKEFVYDNFGNLLQELNKTSDGIITRITLCKIEYDL